MALNHAARGRHEQRKCEISRRVRQDVRRVRHQNASLGGGRHVDVVEADGDVGDDSYAFERGQHVWCELIGKLRNDGLLAAGARQQLGWRKPVVAIDVFDFGMSFEDLDRLRINALCNENLRLH